MHGDQENIGIIEPYWKSVLVQNYTLALPQSSENPVFRWVCMG